MRRKNGFLICSILVILGVIAFFLLRPILESSDPRTRRSEQAAQTNSFGTIKPHVNDETQTRSDKAWGNWVDAQIDLTMEEVFRHFRTEMPYVGPPEQAIDVEDARRKFRKLFEAKAEVLKKDNSGPPPLRLYTEDELHPEGDSTPAGPKPHKGPQTVEALLASFEEMAADPRVDEKYPQDEWVAMLLEKGVTIEHFGDYSRYLTLRGNLITLEQNPSRWTFERYGIPPTNDWETYKDAYIERKIWENQQIIAAQKVDPTIDGGLFSGPNGKTFLPTGGGRYYVKRIPGGITGYGGYMSEEDRYNLTVNGIEPEGYKIIYLDANDTVLSEPPPVNAVEFTNENFPEETLPSALTSEPSFDRNTGDFPSSDEGRPPVPHEKSPEEITVRAEKEARRRAQAEFDALQQLMKTDAEWEAIFEQSLTPDTQVPSLKQTETILIEKYPKRFDDALNLIYIHGPEEGMRQLKNKDPEIAKHLENLFRARK